MTRYSQNKAHYTHNRNRYTLSISPKETIGKEYQFTPAWNAELRLIWLEDMARRKGGVTLEDSKEIANQARTVKLLMEKVDQERSEHA